MITSKKISYLIYVFSILQWPAMRVDSAATASSTQLSSGAAIEDQSKDASSFSSSSSSSSRLLGALDSKSRQSRCVTCYEDRNRYDDRTRYYGSQSGRSGDDRSGSWYYPRHDRYTDERYRSSEGDYDRYGGGDNRYGDRYGMGGSGDRYGYRDDRYDSRSTYDRYDTKGYSRYGERRGSYDRGESRGYGYDNRDRDHDRSYGGERGGEYKRDRYYERPRYGASGSSGYGYDRDYYDRYSPRYASRNYRPWDETYRGQSGFDNAGRGYYYAKGGQEDRRYLPEPSYKSSGGSPCGTLKPNCPYGPQEGGTRVTSGPIDSGKHNTGVSHSIYHANSNQNDSSKGPGAGWSYMREDESDHQPPRGGNANGNSGGGNGGSSSASNRDRNRDQQSPAYGALLDRGSNLIAVEPVKAADNAQENNEKPQQTSSSVDDNANQSASGQNA